MTFLSKARVNSQELQLLAEAQPTNPFCLPLKVYISSRLSTDEKH